jgi:thiosulfate reductase cytochrome b subunit
VRVASAAKGRVPRLLLLIPAAIVVLAIVVLLARWARELPAVSGFIAEYPGTAPLPDGAPVGLPAWVGWQHVLNAFLMVYIVRSGLEIRRGSRPAGHWSPRAGRGRASGSPRRITLTLWLHLAADSLWAANGVVFIVLLFVTGQWMRIVPTTWDVVPHAASVAIQYASLQWPHENGWVAYNALQVLAYFVTVFVAAPLALATGLRMSPWLSTRGGLLARIFPITVARALHFPIAVYFLAFTFVHVVLVLATGALRNLNHMYAGRDDESWWGFAIFGLSVAVMVAGWVAVRPVVVRSIAGLTGSVSR